MKEFYGTTGGRTAFNEDFVALRDLALSFHHIFDDCGENFIISGCEISLLPGTGGSGISINNGYVWLSGKVRKVNGNSFKNSNTVYIIVNDQAGQMINYATKGVFGEMLFDYGTILTTVEPSTGEYIKIGVSETANNIRNVLFNKYVATKSSDKTQIVNDGVNFINGFNTSKIKLSNDDEYVSTSVSPDGELTLSIYSNDVLTRIYTVSNGIKCVDYNNKDLLSIPLPNSNSSPDIKFRDLVCDSINYETVKSLFELYLNNISFSEIFYGKLPSHDWTNLVLADTLGRKMSDIPSLMIKSIRNEVYIAGILPTNDINFVATMVSYDDDTKFADFKTNIKLPEGVPGMINEEGFFNTFTEEFPVRGENITIKNTCTIWRIYNGFLYYKAYMKDKNDNGKGVGLPCPASVFWNFVY